MIIFHPMARCLSVYISIKSLNADRILSIVVKDFPFSYKLQR